MIKFFGMKFLLGILAGIIIILVIIFINEKFLFARYLAPTNYKQIQDSTSFNYKEVTVNEIDFKILNNNIEEKINSVNKRFDDFLVLGGVIVTLLLAINISIFIKARHDVDEHFRENFEEYEKTVKESVDKINKLLGQAEAHTEIIKQYSDNLKIKQTPPQE